MRSLASALPSSTMPTLQRGAAARKMPGSITSSRCCSRRQFACSSSYSSTSSSSSSSPGRRIVSPAAVSKSLRSSHRVLDSRTSSKSSPVASASVANAPTPTMSFLAASAENHAADDDLELPAFDPSSGLIDLVIAGGGPSGLTVAERVSRAGEN